MTITFAAKSDDANVSKDWTKLMALIETTITKSDHNWDLRTIYSSLVGLTEVYREALRSIMKDKDKDQFDAFIDTMNVFITSEISQHTRPAFEQLMSGEKHG